MRFVIRILLCITVVGSLTVLGLSMWPGVLNDGMFLPFLLLYIVLFDAWFIGFPIALIVFAFVAVVIYRRHRQGRLSPLPKLEAAAIPLVAVLTLVLLVFYVPRRVAFVLSRSAFEPMIVSAPTSQYGGAGFDARLGLYRVDRYATDPRGGVFFRVYSGADGFSVDTMSYGFAYEPNQEGTPFGAAHYGLFHVVGDWYWFQASDDWY